ncbi:hypothetical protein PR202_gb03139 [Eleusine coracana subsp. coracana]|uniref:Uncharacterized protein n=1 Tax=Eleusine coracana subsp. coracana TaxID=191504 RepID=A0AAV5DZM4_ELECO|nr:hypothetical protein QOZ80_8BG0660470 [Eleusine coracana subsp. coracana]GJN16179.1 hypothetical protein PR202_gb03139 [Eleusine coracana subsp. coracana]
MRITVRKSPSVMVRPSSEPPPTTSVTEMLSSLDKPFLKLTVTSFLVFEHPIHDAAETIKRALSQALVYYYPFAGRIIATTDGEFHVRCGGDGVAFVAATANCTLKDAKLLDLSNGESMTMTLLEELVDYYPTEGCSPTDPLLLTQVTEFTCGGFVLGVTWHHGIADGIGMAQFLRAVGEFSRGFPSPSVLPVRWDDSLPSLPPSILQHVVGPELLRLACLDVTIPSSLINRIKSSFRDRSNGQTTCTTFEAVAAVLWQCRTRAIVSDPDSMTLLSISVNVRKHLSAKDGYYGNCVFTQQVIARCSVVVNADIVDLIKMIKRAKDEVVVRQGQLLLNNNREGICEMIRAMEPQQRDQLRYNTLCLSSWRNIGFEEVDFGGGTPARVMSYMSPLKALPVCLTSLPCKGTGPGNVLSVCVKEEHADAFVAQLARLNT